MCQVAELYARPNSDLISHQLHLLADNLIGFTNFTSLITRVIEAGIFPTAIIFRIHQHDLTGGNQKIKLHWYYPFNQPQSLYQLIL